MARSGDELHGADGNMREALTFMEHALALLDKADSVFDVAAHLDLAIHRLNEKLVAERVMPCGDSFLATNVLAA